MPGEPPPLPDFDPRPDDRTASTSRPPAGAASSSEQVFPELFRLQIPMARPVSIDALREGRDTAASVSPGADGLTVGGAIVQILLVLLAGTAGAFAAGFVSTLLPLGDRRWGELITTAGAGAAGMAAVFMMVRLAGQRPAAIGWRINRAGADIGLGVGMAFAVYLVMILAAMAWVAFNPQVLNERTQAQQAIEQAIPHTSILSLVLMMSFVAVWEEVVFRGFLLTRLRAIFRRWWLAVLFGAVLFSLGHGWQGRVATVITGSVGVFLGLLFVWRRSLLPPVAFHLTFNLIGMLLLRAQGGSGQ